MDAKLRKQWQIYAQMPEHKSKLAAARRCIAAALAIAPSWYIALSGGKDSTVVLDLVRQQAADTPALFGDDEWNLPDTDAYIAAVPHCTRVAAPVQHAGFFTAWATRRPDDGVTQWCDAKDGLVSFARQHGYIGVMLGLRAEESAIRQVHLRTLGICHRNQATDVWQCNPIAWWSVMDVWAYIVANGVPYNAAYDRLSEIGVPLAHQRIGPLAVERVLGYGQLAILKRGWPDLYNRFAERFPEVRAYV